MTVTGALPAGQVLWSLTLQQHQNNDARLKNCFDLINTYTREEIEVEYILDCLYAELWVQSSPDVQDVLANSMLGCIWKIGNCSSLYTTETYRNKLQLFGVLQSQQSSFDDFVWAFSDRNYQQVRSVANSVLF